MNGLFITGADTGVGKTIIACAYCAKLKQQGWQVAPRKPVESGCELKNNQLFAADAWQLQQASKTADTLAQINHFCFARAISPARAARQKNVNLSMTDLLAACAADDEHFLLVEGAGGWLSPLADNISNADLALALDLPIILVVENRLGCINQTMLVVEAVKRRNLQVQTIVLNTLSNIAYNEEDADDLRQMVNIPVIVTPYITGDNIWQQIGTYL